MAHSSAVAEGAAGAGTGGLASAASGPRQGGVTSADVALANGTLAAGAAVAAVEASEAGQPGGGPSGCVGTAVGLAFCNGGWPVAGGPGGFLFGRGGTGGGRSRISLGRQDETAI